MIYCDDAGPHNSPALGGFYYFRTFVDAHSRFRLTYLLRKRTDGLAATATFIAEFNATAGDSGGTQLIARMHTDGAREFFGHEFRSLLARNNISHTNSPAHI